MPSASAPPVTAADSSTTTSTIPHNNEEDQLEQNIYRKKKLDLGGIIVRVRWRNMVVRLRGQWKIGVRKAPFH